MAKLERVKLTPGRIASFSCPPEKAQTFLWDSEVPGFAIRATPPGKRTPNGTRAYIFQGYLNGATPRLTIGDTKVWNLDDARIEARRLQALLDKGIDPREQKRELEEVKATAKAATEAAQNEKESKQCYTLRALLDAYCEHLEANGKAQSARQAKSIFKCHVFEAHPDIAALPASEVTPDHAATMVRYLSASFNAGRKARYNAKLPAAFIAYQVQINPMEIIATIAVNRGDRTLNADDLKRYIAALSDDDLSDLALKLALFSGGQRMAQLLRAKVSDYDKDSQTPRLWDGKGKRSTPREHLLPLASKAAAIVEKLIERAKPLETPLLFSSFGKTQLVETTPGKRATAICKTMKCEAFDLRDIRRTCETMLAGMGISRDTRAQLLSHGLSGVQAAHYDRHSYTNEKRAALVAWEKRLDDIATGRHAANVLQMKRKGRTAA